MLTHQDLIQLADMAQQYLLDLPQEGRLEGMNKALALREQIALSYLKAVTALLNKNGVLSPNEVINLEVPIVVPDSDSQTDYHDYDDLEES